MSGPAGAAAARIGPNAVTRLAEAIETLHGAGIRHSVFADAGCLRHLADPPKDMVDELDVARLHLALRDALGPQCAEAASRVAGELTARYLLENRIPRRAQALLRRLPRGLALRILCAAIARHAWTFAGSGSFRATFRPETKLTITHGPVARLITAQEPACAYYAATFEHVISGALGRQVLVRETECEAAGAPACVFALAWA